MIYYYPHVQAASMSGCLAQRESIALTRRGSQVRNLQHPPSEKKNVYVLSIVGEQRSGQTRLTVNQLLTVRWFKSIFAHHPLLGCSQVVRQQTLTLSFRWFDPSHPSHDSSVSSVVEHLTFNQGVVSSSLTRGTKLTIDYWFLWREPISLSGIQRMTAARVAEWQTQGT